MTTKDKTEQEAPEESSSLYDFDDVPPTESSQAAVINTPGIHHNLKARLELISGDYKSKETGEPVHWSALKLILTNPDNLEHVDNYFAPPSSVENVKYPQQKHELIDGKMVETREASKEETLKILNNEYIAFLYDLGEAFGYKQADMKEYLARYAKGGFESVTKAFIEKFKPNEAKRISAKILWDNNSKKQESYLKIHPTYPKYYPYGNDLFDVWVEGRPTVLKLKPSEEKKGLVKKYTGQADAPKTDATVTKQGGYKSAVATEDDPF